MIAILLLVVGTIAAELEDLVVKEPAPHTGYSRARFGPAWKDTDGNGCDTRNDVLARDLEDEVVERSCVVVAGVLQDLYTGRRIVFVRGRSTSSRVQIDHVVALSNAWATGAQALSTTRRLELANDPLNLRAVDGPTNGSKGDDDASRWLPPSTAAWCWYAQAQVDVKAKYGLWVTAAERDALARVLATCP